MKKSSICFILFVLFIVVAASLHDTHIMTNEDINTYELKN